MTRVHFALAPAALTLALAGCGPTGGVTTTLNGPSGTTSWYASGDAAKSSPLDEGVVNYAGTNLVVWSGSTKGSGINCRHTVGEMTIDAIMRFADGTRLAVKCTSPDGNTGAVSVGDETFQLADGNLFLVSGTGDRPRVKQLKRDLWGINFKDHKSLQAFGKADPEIVTFFTGP